MVFGRVFLVFLVFFCLTNLFFWECVCFFPYEFFLFFFE